MSIGSKKEKMISINENRVPMNSANKKGEVSKPIHGD